MPWRLRMGLRRIFARRQLRAYRHVWPIDESAAQPPSGWAGWPGGNKFALVLTHDVEGSSGLGKCRQLMQLEQKLGFRSSFNFIPEGQYRVSSDLLMEMRQNGFEVGVHDLHHDGKLYWRRGAFQKNAARINHYLKTWNARGFRAGFMLFDRDSLNDLDILYDASTFDTDPFEPQPEGVRTIFPFWVPRPGGGGHVELPYTLPQDSTLYLVLRERSNEIWKRKLAWIVKHGGMALVIVHPDYLGFNENSGCRTQYPAALYEEFLRHVHSEYGGAFWNPLPREAAQWYKENILPARAEVAVASRETISLQSHTPTDSQSSLAGKNVGVVLFSHYLSDPRPRRAAEILAQQGATVEVICLRANETEPARETVNGVKIRRVRLKRQRGGKLTYIYQYSAFTLAAFFFLTARSLKRRYHLIHAHNMPDVLVFSALIPKLLRGKVILDLHDPMPELMLTIFKLPPNSFAVRSLKLLEKWSTAFADMVLTVNLASKRIYSSRSCAPEKIRVVMNSPNESVFQFQPLLPTDRNGEHPPQFAIMYHGSLLQRNGFDLAIQALKIVRRKIPGAILAVCGERTPFFEQVMSSVGEHGLTGAVNYLGMKSPEEIVAAIDRCDLGIIPNHRNIFTEMNTPTRIFEYLSRGKPVIAPRARGIQDYFGDADMIYFELGDVADLARQIEYAYFHPAEVRETVGRGQKIYLAHRWSQESRGFVDTVAGLLGRS